VRLLFDIGHPAHVHYFRNLVSLLEEGGHEVLVTSREKDILVKGLSAEEVRKKLGV
jgi:predicted glycosyltransferase